MDKSGSSFTVCGNFVGNLSFIQYETVLSAEICGNFSGITLISTLLSVIDIKPPAYYNISIERYQIFTLHGVVYVLVFANGLLIGPYEISGKTLYEQVPISKGNG